MKVLRTLPLLVCAVWGFFNRLAVMMGLGLATILSPQQTLAQPPPQVFDNLKPRVGGVCGLYAVGDPAAPVHIDLTSVSAGPFAIALRWTGPPGSYELGTYDPRTSILNFPPLTTVTSAATINKSISPGTPIFSPRSGGTPIVFAPAGQSFSFAHSPIVPDTTYHYWIKAKLADGQSACGTALGQSSQPPVVNRITGRYMNVRQVSLDFVVPPYAHEAHVYRKDGTVVATLQTPGQHYAGAVERAVTGLMVDPGPPPHPYINGRYSMAQSSYDFIVEAVWTAQVDGSGARKSSRTAAVVNGPPPIQGYADLHTHQFGNLGFGGWAVAGQPFGPASAALAWCDAQQQHGPGGVADVMANLARKYLTGQSPVGHKVGGYPEFDGWPHWSSISHQQMWQQWLKRAHDGGLKLMVMHAVNNEHFCSHAHRVTGRTCDDREAVRLQIDGAKAMQAAIDAEAGGTGLGWYRIVYSPQEARAAIAAGQLAVVLGVEVDNPFPFTDVQAALNQLDVYRQMGARHFFPIHFIDNSIGGAAFDKELTVPRGTYVDPGIGALKHPYRMDVRDCSPTYRRQGGKCNQRGLTPLGREVIIGMAQRGLIIDVDHMSEVSFNETMNILTPYPVVSGHTGFVELALNASDPDKSHEGNMTLERLNRIQQSGGMVAIIANQGKQDQIDTFREGTVVIEHMCGNTSETVAQAYLYVTTRAPGMPVGFSTDMNALFNMPGPRFGSDACPGGKGARQSQVNRAQMSYPFVAGATNLVFHKSVAVENDPKVTKKFDFNVDGLAHIGMVPDLIEDLRILGIPAAAFRPLFSSAEGYIRAWERATYRASK